ncbi:MAG: glucosamine-6-phosphate deaminase, partial [Chloroflexi bacterium]|nr:glucosamine-6-phosphate deaminase [Chloroflexota bacterium]
MIIIQAKDYDEMSRKAALFISGQVLLKPTSLLGLAT